MEKEALTLDNLNMAIAAKNSGGLVIAQVERLTSNGSLNSRNVKIPGSNQSNHFVSQIFKSFGGLCCYFY